MDQEPLKAHQEPLSFEIVSYYMFQEIEGRDQEPLRYLRRGCYLLSTFFTHDLPMLLMVYHVVTYDLPLHSFHMNKRDLVDHK